LLQFLETGENAQVEFKTSFDREAIESLSAFANATGGTVVVGVDDNGVVHGLQLGRDPK
jgi:ATP-dependent DNA helicase RecG